MEPQVVENKTRIDLLEERFDRHLTSMEKKFDKIDEKIDLIVKNINQITIDGINHENTTKVKLNNIGYKVHLMYISIIGLWTFLWSWAKGLIIKMLHN